MPVVRSACELDLLVFLSRHPRALLTTESLANFVGYHLKQIAEALDTFIDAGLLERTAQQSTHAARMFVLMLNGPRGDDLLALIELAATPVGRRSVLDALAGRPPPTSRAGPELNLLRRA
jgi:hypothetical protein